MSRIAVVGDDVLAVALARQLATSTAEVAHHPLRSLTSVRGVHSTLRLLSPVAEQLNRERTAMSAWRSLETETGAALLTGVDAVEVGPASTVAATLRATLDGDAAAPMSPMEAARRWPAIRFDGTVAHQPAARRIDLALARTALRRSAVSLGARFATAPVKRAWLTTSGEVELLDAQGWHHYDAAVVVTDSRDRAALGCLPTDLAMSTVLTVSPIGPAAGWPSVVHHAGLPADPDGFRIAGACAEVRGSRVELALTVASGTDAAGLLWEYAVRWLPGTIVGGSRVRTEPATAPQRVGITDRLAVVSPLGVRSGALAPLFAMELAPTLFDGVAHDYERERAS